MFDFLKRKEPEKKVEEIEIKSPALPYLFSVRLLPYGTQYNCHKAPRRKREALIRELKEGERVSLKAGTFGGEQLYYVIRRDGLDVGTVSGPFRSYITDMITHPQFAATVDQTDPLAINIEVHGKWKDEWEFYDGGEKNKEYTYGINSSVEYMRIPAAEIMCDLVQIEDTFVVKAAGMMIGTLYQKRTEKLAEMLEKYDCTTTVYIEPGNYDGRLRMTLRF